MAGGIIARMTPAELLAFEHRNPTWFGNKETRIREELGLSPARYVVLLERAAASTEGQIADPVTAHRVTSFTPSRDRWRSVAPLADVGRMWAKTPRTPGDLLSASGQSGVRDGRG
ncbi:MAG: hypothetical protein B7X41_15895 [Microbacterium sp. 14-71-5]|nr:MAG: hypothetical protein B7X41_15895 [Microbacterium sp. 14-71-5]